MKKSVFYTELCYVIGIIVLALGTAFMECADFGMSMVVAPAYILHLKLSQYFPFYSFGMSEYIFQAFLLILTGLCLRKFKKSYLFSFVTAVVYGFALDFSLVLISRFPGYTQVKTGSDLFLRLVFFVIGMLFCSTGVAFMFHTYISPEAYELFVKEFSEHFGTDIGKTKTCYDCISCLFGLFLSFLFFGFGHFEGVKAGTIVCALVNGQLIGNIGRYLEKRFDFRDALPFGEFFSH